MVPSLPADLTVLVFPNLPCGSLSLRTMHVVLFSVLLGQWFSQWEPRTSSPSRTWGLKLANSVETLEWWQHSMW